MQVCEVTAFRSTDHSLPQASLAKGFQPLLWEEQNKNILLPLETT